MRDFLEASDQADKFLVLWTNFYGEVFGLPYSTVPRKERDRVVDFFGGCEISAEGAAVIAALAWLTAQTHRAPANKRDRLFFSRKLATRSDLFVKWIHKIVAELDHHIDGWRGWTELESPTIEKVRKFLSNPKAARADCTQPPQPRLKREGSVLYGAI